MYVCGHLLPTLFIAEHYVTSSPVQQYVKDLTFFSSYNIIIICLATIENSPFCYACCVSRNNGYEKAIEKKQPRSGYVFLYVEYVDICTRIQVTLSGIHVQDLQRITTCRVLFFVLSQRKFSTYVFLHVACGRARCCMHTTLYICIYYTMCNPCIFPN